MSDARWIEVEADVAAAVRHFGKALELWRAGGFGGEGLENYRAEMALMHALQSAHTSLERDGVRWKRGLAKQGIAGVPPAFADASHAPQRCRRKRRTSGRDARDPLGGRAA